MTPKKKRWIDWLFWPLDYLFFPVALPLAVTLVAAVVFPFFARARGTGHGPICSSNLKQLGFALLQYSQDYSNTRLPPVASSGVNYGWADALYPYTKNHSIYHCPLVANRQTPNEVEPNQNGYTDYYLNAHFSGAILPWKSPMAQEILLGEGNDGVDITDARYAKSTFPLNWLNNADSPLYRHQQMANYFFVDGHMKAFKPTTVQIQLERGQLVF